MELKYVSYYSHFSSSLLLIVPYGIEMILIQLLKARHRLLIVPYGIEMYGETSVVPFANVF